MTNLQPERLVRDQIQALLNGDAPAPLPPEQLGDWAALVADLHAAYDLDGTRAVRRAFTTSCRVHPDLARLVAADPAPVAERVSSAMSPLPAPAAAILAHQAPCAAWLDAYIAFGLAAAPMTPRSFHEAAGLFAVSVAIARRLVFRSGTGGTSPNLFLLQIAPPAIYKKTTGLNVMADLLDAAGLSHLLLANSVTPQALTRELSTSVPPEVEDYDDERRGEWLRERAFAAQRGWFLDEAAGLFDSFEREYNTGLHLLILRLYDCAERLREQTAARGRVSVQRAYISLLGATTPDTIRRHFNNRTLWGSGLWSRFGLVVPDTAPVYHPRPPKMALPLTLIAGLRRIFDLFPCPHAEWVLGEGEGARRRPSVTLWGVVEPSEAVFAEGVLDALDAYARAVGFTLLQEGGVEATLWSAYDRLGGHAIKLALLLATLDAEQLPVRVEPRHAARAVEIAETWRAALHQIWSEGAATEETTLADRLLASLERVAPQGLSTRELCQLLHRSSQEVRAALDLLQEAGYVSNQQSGRKLIWARCATDDESVASVAKRSTTDATPVSLVLTPETPYV